MPASSPSRVTLSNVGDMAVGPEYQKRKVAKWSGCPQDILLTLFKSFSKRVSWLAGVNPNFPTSMMRSIVEEYVASLDMADKPGIASANTPTIVSVDGTRVLGDQILTLLYNPNFPTELMEVLLERQIASRWESWIALNHRRMILTHKNCSVGITAKALKRWSDPSLSSWGYETRAAIASSEYVSEENVQTLINDRDWQVHRALALNKAIPEGLLLPLVGSRNVKVLNALSKRYDGEVREKVLSQLEAASNGVVARRIVAARTSNQSKVLAAALDPDEQVRAAAIGNPAANDEAKVASALYEGSL